MGVLTSRGLGIVLHSYGLRLRKITVCRSLYKRRAAFYARTDRGGVLIKPFHKSDRRLNLLSTRIARLQRRGYRNMPGWYSTKKGRKWVKWGGRSFYVTRWIDGRPLRATFGDSRSLGEALAKLHVRSRNVVRGPNLLLLGEIRFLRQSDALFRRQLRLLQKRRGPVGQWYREHGRQCISLADQAWAALGRLENRRALQREVQQPSLVHGDVTKPNVLVSRGRIYFVDWDCMGPGFTLLELARTLANTSDFSPDRMNATLHGYKKHRILQKEEKKIVSSLFQLPWEAWQAAKKATRHKVSPEFSVLQKTWSKRLTAVRWLKSWAER